MNTNQQLASVRSTQSVECLSDILQVIQSKNYIYNKTFNLFGNIITGVLMDRSQLVFLQFFLIWPFEPVRGLRLLIFTIAFAKSEAKAEGFEL